jgi:hypothetical protein
LRRVVWWNLTDVSEVHTASNIPFQSSWRRQQALLKRRETSTRLHDGTTQDTAIFKNINDMRQTKTKH